MARQVQRRRGTTAQNDAFTGAAGEITVDTDLNELRIHDGSTAGGYRMPRSGRQTIGLPLNAAVPRGTNGAAALSEEEATTFNMTTGFRFAQSVDQYVQARAPMPLGWDLGTVQARFRFRCPVVTTGDVRWGIQAVALKDDTPSSIAFGTAVFVVGTAKAAAGSSVWTAETASITVGNTPAFPCVVQWQIYRNGSDAADTAAGDADLLDAHLYYKTTSLVDD